MAEQNAMRHILANNLKWLRMQNGYSQKNIADILQIDRSTYAYYELGKSRPDMETVKKLALLYRVDSTFLLQPHDRHTDYENRRTKKRINANPLKIEELSNQERSLIALLRTQTAESLQALVTELLQKYG